MILDIKLLGVFMSESATSVIEKIKGIIAKLPFNNLVAKIPQLAKFSGYANYIACAVAIIFLGILFTPSKSVKPAVSELKKVNNETARFWIKMIEDNGIDAIYDKTTLLKVAIDSENYDLVKACIKSGANINLQPDEYRTLPIVQAIEKNNAKIVELLIKNKAVLVVSGHIYGGDAVKATLRSLDENMIKLVIPRIPKSEINFLDENNKRTEEIYNPNSKNAMKSLAILINDYGYKTEVNFDELQCAIRDADAKNIPDLIKAIKNTASEDYYKDKERKSHSNAINTAEYAITYRYKPDIFNQNRSKFDISLPEEQKAKEQIEELVSWLEKQGYERKSK